MRLIGEIADSEQAQKFRAFLVVSRIAANVETIDSGGHEIWVKDEDQFQAAMQELEAFRQDPDHDRYSGAVHQADQVIRKQIKKRLEIQKKIVNVRAGVVKKRSPFTILLIIACAIVALLTNFGDCEPNVPIYRALQFVYIDATDAEAVWAESGYDKDSLHLRLASIKRGEIWRLVTTIFIHLGVMHLVFNMIMLYRFGQQIENRYGTLWMVFLVLITAAISNFMQCSVPVSWGGANPGLVEGELMSGGGGMSGVIYGLFGYIWMKSIYDRSSGFFMSQSTINVLVCWLFICMIPGLTQSLLGFSVGNWAHGVGLIVGLVIGYAPEWIRQQKR